MRRLLRDGLRDLLVEPRRAPLIPGFVAGQGGGARPRRARREHFRRPGRACSRGSHRSAEAEAAAPAMQAASRRPGSSSRAYVSPVAGPRADVIGRFPVRRVTARHSREGGNAMDVCSLPDNWPQVQHVLDEFNENALARIKSDPSSSLRCAKGTETGSSESSAHELHQHPRHMRRPPPSTRPSSPDSRPTAACTCPNASRRSTLHRRRATLADTAHRRARALLRRDRRCAIARGDLRARAIRFAAPLRPLAGDGRPSARAVPRTDRRVQGLRRALPGRVPCRALRSDGRAADHDPGRHLRRHRRGGRGGVPSPSRLRGRDPVSGRPRLAAAGARTGVLGRQRAHVPRRRQLRRLPAAGQAGAVGRVAAAAMSLEFGQQHQPRPPAAADRLLRARGRAAFFAEHGQRAELHRPHRQPRQCLRGVAGAAHGRCRSASSCWRAMPTTCCRATSPATTTRRRPTRATLANAMDVGAPSNFERLRYWHDGRCAACARPCARMRSTTPPSPRHDPRRRRSATASCPARTPRPACTCWNDCAMQGDRRPGRSSPPRIRPSSRASSNRWSATPSSRRRPWPQDACPGRPSPSHWRSTIAALRAAEASLKRIDAAAYACVGVSARHRFKRNC